MTTLVLADGDTLAALNRVGDALKFLFLCMSLSQNRCALLRDMH
jgi:hypothetical protein